MIWPHCIPSHSWYSEDIRCRWWTLINGWRYESCIRNQWTNHWKKNLSWPRSNSSRVKYSQSMLLLQCQQPLDDCRVACSSRSRWYALTAGIESTSGNPSLSYRLFISLIISLIPPWTFAAFTGFTAITTTFLCKEQSFWSESFPSHNCRFLFNERVDDLIGVDGHRCVFVHHELQEHVPLVVPWDPAKKVEDVFLLAALHDCLCSVRISVSGRWPRAENIILDFPIDPRCLIVDISTVL